MHEVLHSLEHAFFDSIKILPFIFLIYLLIEYLEHKNNTKLSHILMKAHKFGPVYGSILGSIPQCGFSVIASDLFARRAITAGTMIAIFIATSDEAVPILLSEPSKAHLVLAVIGVKIVIAVISGLLIDLVYRKRSHDNHCHDEHPHEHFHGNCESCGDGVLKSTIKHTVKIFVFIFIVSFVMTLLIEMVGEDELSKLLLKDSTVQPFIAALIGLIPNCAASVMLTEMYVVGAVSFGSLIAGLSAGAGIGILLLFRKNKNIKENLCILGTLYLIGALSGIIIQLIGLKL